MKTEAYSPKVLGHGQGKCATTILTEGGYVYPIVSSTSYNDRIKSAPYTYGRGARPMHRSTLTITKPPWNSHEEYKTTAKQYFSGSKSLNPVRRPPLCPSMHRSQIKMAHPSDEKRGWDTDYTGTYREKDIVPANRLHLISLRNRIDQTEGGEMKKVVKPDQSPQSYFTQYNRTHNKLGNLLGPGVPRGYPIRESYNILTGEETGLAWKEDNKRTSGNRHLYDSRCADRSYSILC
ncbi:unnamed protein product [Mytilus coruscus]|uniref:Uncharacterized protein n=1 Tax=Mytilus coruscus TaxID=42192 RepID=A0A6J8B5F8_MYTCO|nr:unnamed protein product [Mytilus coruscus]